MNMNKSTNYMPLRTGLVGLCIGPVLSAAVLAQAAPASEPETEAMARAKRDAEKVFSWIRKDGDGTPQPKRKDADDAPPAPKPAPKPVAQKPAPRPAPAPAAKAAPAPSPAAADAAPPAMAPAVATKQAAAAPTPAPAPALPAAMFDFEKSPEGFTANDGYKWGASAGADISLVDKAARGAKGLQVKVSRDSWVGRDFEGEDWGGKAYLVFSLHSERGYIGKVGFKTGPDWSWCDARAVASGESKGFTTYRVALDSKLCPSLDKRDVRGMHLWIGAGDTVTLDNFYLAD